MSQREVAKWPVPRGAPPWGGLFSGAPNAFRAALFAVMLRRPPGSRLRRRLITDGARFGFDLLNRRDREVDRILRLYDPACEIHVGPGFPLDLAPVYRGHAGWLEFVRTWDDAMSMEFAPKQALDMGGPCFAVLVSAELVGATSGARAPIWPVWTYTLRRGLVLRQDIRNDGWEVAPQELAAALQRLTPETVVPR